MKFIIIICLLFSGCTQSLKEESIENTVWAINDGFTSYSITIKKQNEVSLSYFSDNGPTIYTRKGIYEIKNNILLLNFPEVEITQEPYGFGGFKIESKTHDLPALRQEFKININSEKKYLEGEFNLYYVSKYSSEVRVVIPVTKKDSLKDY